MFLGKYDLVRRIQTPLLTVILCDLLVSLHSTSVQAKASSIQACLETYQAAAEQQRDEVLDYNSEIKEKTEPRARTVYAKDFPKMHGPGHFFKDHNDNYFLGSIFTIGALPLAHYVVKGGYELSKHMISTVANISRVTANLGRKTQRSVQLRKVPTPFEEEIELIRDLIQYNQDEIIFSPQFKKIVKTRAIRERYNDFRDVYSILKLTFEKRLPCPDRVGFTPSSLEHILRDLSTGELQVATGYKKNAESETHEDQDAGNKTVESAKSPLYSDSLQLSEFFQRTR